MKATRTGLFPEVDSPPNDVELFDIDDGDERAHSMGGRICMLPPLAYAELSDFFGPLERFAQSCGNADAGYFLRNIRMSFLAAYAPTKTRQREYST